jgi:hypothetical protein
MKLGIIEYAIHYDRHNLEKRIFGKEVQTYVRYHCLDF